MADEKEDGPETVGAKEQPTEKEAHEEEVAFAAAVAGQAPSPAGEEQPPAEGEAEGEGGEETPPEPEYVQLTKADYEAIIEGQKKLEGTLSKVAGNAGNLQQIVTRLQAATPSGQLLEFTDEDFPELAEEVPEVAKMIVGGLNRWAKRGSVRGTGEGTAPPPAGVKVEDVAEVLRNREIDLLTSLEPDWRETVGANLDEEARKENPFRKWLDLQDPAYRDKVRTSQFAAVTIDAIAKFRADQAKAAREAAAAAAAAKSTKPPASTARQERLQSNVQPRGAGGRAPTGQMTTEEDRKSVV